MSDNEFSGFVKYFHGDERYLVLNRHGTSIMKTFDIEAAGSDLRFSLRARTHFLFTKLTIRNTVLCLRLQKSF